MSNGTFPSFTFVPFAQNVFPLPKSLLFFTAQILSPLPSLQDHVSTLRSLYPVFPIMTLSSVPRSWHFGYCSILGLCHASLLGNTYLEKTNCLILCPYSTWLKVIDLIGTREV